MSLRLYLASQSPRRGELLRQIGMDFECIDGTVEETRGLAETALEYGKRVARDKAKAGSRLVATDAGAWVLGADTEVVLDDEVFGKPSDGADAERMLARLSGCSHRVISAVALVGRGECFETVSISEVRFARMSDTQIRDYVATGEPFGKAGGYAIQGRAAAFIAHLSGSYSGVMGLPLHETGELLRRVGFVL